MRCVLDPTNSVLGFHFNRSHGNEILECGVGMLLKLQRKWHIHEQKTL